MKLLDQLRGRTSRRTAPAARPRAVRYATPCLEALEDRFLPDATGVLNLGVLTVTGQANAFNRIEIVRNGTNLILSDNGIVNGVFPNAAVNAIVVNANGLFNTVRILADVGQPVTFNGGPASSANYFFAGGGPTVMNAGPGFNRLVGGPLNDVLNANQGINVLSGGLGTNQYFGAGAVRNFYLGNVNHDTIVTANPGRDVDLRVNAPDAPDLSQTLGLPPTGDADPANQLTAQEVDTLLKRAAAATASDDGIVAVVDRGGRVLGVRVEGGVDPGITGNQPNLIFAVDGALAEARTGAFFGNDQAPLTSRTIQFISQTTITQREIQSNPSITDANSPLKGPGFVAPQGIGAHFPPGVMHTPQVDLFAIESTNRDTTNHPVYDANGNVTAFVPLPERFNVNPAFIPPGILASGEQLMAPDSYGFFSGLNPDAQPRGIGTLPGGLPIYKNGFEVGGLGVFFPGKTGFASEENSALSDTFDPTKRDRSEEAEYAAFAALGGVGPFPVGNLGGLAPLPELSTTPPGTNLSNPPGSVDARIDLVGITLDIFGPGGVQGPQNLFNFGQTLGVGNPNSGFNAPLLARDAHNNLLPNTMAPNNELPGVAVPEGFLVTPHDGPSGLTAQDVQQMIAQGVQQAQRTRAAIRLPLDSTAVMVIAVADQQTGEILGLFRMPDSTVFSIDVAVAKSRNVAYYANAAALQPQDQVAGVPPGTAFTNRTFRYLADPRFPEGVDGTPPGPFSILNDGGVDPQTGAEVGPPLPAGAFQSVLGHDAFFPQTNFHDPFNPLNQNGIVFFPGSSPLYRSSQLVGGLGVSGDGVDQDDVVTFSAIQGFATPDNVLRADQVFVRGVRLPFQKFNRQPIEP